MKQTQLLFKENSSNTGFYSKISFSFSYVIAILSVTAIITFGISNYINFKINEKIGNSSYSKGNGDLESEENSHFSQITVQKGDTLSRILGLQELKNNEIYNIVNAIKRAKIKYNLKPGQIVTFDYDVVESEEDSLSEYSLREINIILDRTRNILVSKSADGIYKVKEIKAELQKKFVKHKVEVADSFVSTLSSLGLSAANIQEIVKAYSYEVDFQRQIKKGDTLNILCEKFYTNEGDFVHGGRILFSSLKLSGKEHNIYWFKPSKAMSGQYYTENGKSVKRSLLRTPVDVVRISSKFGMRRHPVLGYTKMHKGVDFAAPRGTPIKAAGDGIVKDMGKRGAYGNIVRIRHNNSTVTAYAHASRFAKNLKPGTRVKQGQVIAYVGNTGRATGPHCHFEVVINGKHVNPMSVHSSPGRLLTKAKLNEFTEYKNRLKSYSMNLAEGAPIELANLD